MNMIPIIFTFIRSIKSIPVTYVTADDPNGATYREEWQQESLSIDVEDTGVKGIRWISPRNWSKKLNSNVQLLNFNKIMDTFCKQALIRVAYNKDVAAKYVLKREFHIDRIVLGGMVVAMQNTQSEYLIIPVWDFFGYEVDTYSKDYLNEPGLYVLNENNQREIRVANHSYLTINAIDGTVIDRRLGY